MKRTILSSFIVGVSFLLLSTTAFAADSMQEKPGISIVIDGKVCKTDNVPIIQNNRTLLPMVALLTNLGVQNDKQHILWNGKEQSITVNKDSTKIYLKINSKKAIVNNKAMAIDSEPITYKGRTYIPASFIAQSLGKKVAWDSSTETVYINDESAYNKNSDILNKSVKAMNLVDKYVFNGDTHVCHKMGETIDSDTKNKTLFKIDKKNSLVYSDSNTIYFNESSGQTVNYNFTRLGIQNRNYVKTVVNGTDNDWTDDKDLGSQKSTDVFFNTTTRVIDISKEIPLLSTGLVPKEDTANHMITLEGDVYIRGIDEKPGTLPEPTVYHTKIVVNKDTYLFDKLIYNIGTSDETSQEFTFSYSEYNGSFTIDVPEQVSKLEKQKGAETPGANGSNTSGNTSTTTNTGDENPKIINVSIQTDKGEIVVALRPDLMPVTVTNFMKLVNKDFYNGLTFHRVEDWVIQGGDPKGDGTGGSDETIVLETSPKLKNVKYAVAMARSRNPDSASSQFYILKTDADWLDGQYAVFGNVIKGQDVVDKIAIGDKMKEVKEVK